MTTIMIGTMTRSTRTALAVVLAIAALASPPAFAVNKDLVQIQTQIQDLQEAVAKLQQSNDERMGVLKDLVQQNADSVNKLSVTVDSLTKVVRSQQDATGGKLDQVSGQVTALNDSVDEIKARLNRLDKALQDIQTQQQSINATLQNMAPSPSATGTVPGAQGAVSPASPDIPAQAPTAAIAVPPAPQQAPIVNRRGKPSAGTPLAATTPLTPLPVPPPASGSSAPPASDLYRTALSDYMAAKFPLAAQEFNEVIRNYPEDNLSGTSYYYLGEIDYRAGKYAAAVKDYDRVLERFPDNARVPVSHLHKGMALIALKQNDAGVNELRALITRFPLSPEATQARNRLNGMGVATAPRSQRP